ncbi:FAD-dependent oxidoreductase [Candidatus Sumerlaeota bacterium]|nr:FAD-dependent oxidoreductase [Candidatus Sumerlaeota bacterium]
MFERKDAVGGRNYPLRLKNFIFDLGPTFFLMTDVLQDIFSATSRRMEDYIQLIEIDPLYRLRFDNGVEFLPTKDADSMKKQMENWIVGSFKGYEKYLKCEKKKYDAIIPCLRAPYHSWMSYFSLRILRSIPRLDAHISLFSQLGRYFKDPDMRVAFCFQAKYLGMSPWQCPGIFSILSFIEHQGGVFHVKGGMNRLSQAMAKVIEEDKGMIHLSTPVEKIIFENRKATGAQLANGEIIKGDHVIINADFAYAMDQLVDEGRRRKYTREKLHKGNVDDISRFYRLSEDPSFYIQNASITDDALAPPGKSALYVLVPTPNNKSGIDWKKRKESFKELILNLVEEKGGLKDLRNHIEVMKVVTPLDWEKGENVFLGATFNLAHSIDQMLIFRPHNRFEEFDNCYLVGGGIHPGSGLPTIYESGNITAKLIMERDGVKVNWS